MAVRRLLCRTQARALWSVLMFLLLASSWDGLGGGRQFCLLPVGCLAAAAPTTGLGGDRAPFKHLRGAEKYVSESKGSLLGGWLRSCAPLCSSAATLYRACVVRMQIAWGETVEMAAFVSEQLNALADNRDPRDLDALKQQHDRPAPVEPPWEDVAPVTEANKDDLVVPSWRFETVKDAVESCKNGARVYARKGDHHWDGKITVRGASSIHGTRFLHVVGESKAKLWGRWSISRLSAGTFKAVVCAYETEGVGWPCVLVRGDPWLFDSCQLRAAGAYSVMCAKNSRATLRRCGVGGMGGGPRRAISSVIVMDSSWCLIQQCQVEDTDSTHPGVRLIENGNGRLDQCILQRNGYGVAVDNNAKVSISACILRDNHHAAFMAGWEAGNAEMEIRSCTVYGRVWHTVDRPGSLSECDNRFTVSSMQQASRDVAQDRYKASSPSPPIAEDRSWRDGRDPGRKGFTALWHPSAAHPADSGPGVFVGGRHAHLARAMSFPNLRESEGTPSRASSPAPVVPETDSGAGGLPSSWRQHGQSEAGGATQVERGQARSLPTGPSAAEGGHSFDGASSELLPPRQNAVEEAGSPAPRPVSARALPTREAGAGQSSGERERREGDAHLNQTRSRRESSSATARTGYPALASRGSRLTIRPKSPLRHMLPRRSHSTSSLTGLSDKGGGQVESAGRRRLVRKQHTALLSERYTSRSASAGQVPQRSASTPLEPSKRGVAAEVYGDLDFDYETGP